jgi:cell division septal protein FtsQ
VEGVGWVKEAKVVRLLPDTVVIAVKERPALAVWQSRRDARHRRRRPSHPEADAARFPQLPLVVGQGADQAAGAILPAVAPGRACAIVSKRWCASTIAAGTAPERRLADPATGH